MQEARFISEIAAKMLASGWECRELPMLGAFAYDAAFSRDGMVIILQVKQEQGPASAGWVLALSEMVSSVEDSLRPFRGARGILVTSANVTERLAAAAA